jgi:hypothetical protein
MGPSNKFHLERLLNPFGVFLHGGSLWIDTLVLEVVLFLHFYHTAPALAQDSHDPAWTHIGCDMRVRRLWRTHRVNMSDSDRGHGVVQTLLRLYQPRCPNPTQGPPINAYSMYDQPRYVP